MITRRPVVLAALFATVLPMLSARAAFEPRLPFTDETLATAKAAGGPVLVEITAPWCPTCKAQKAVLADLGARPDFGAFTVVSVDFDSQKDAVRALGATMQSTLIVYRGETETGRVVGVTDAAAIEALLRTAL
jgi:thioredoxin 1